MKKCTYALWAMILFFCPTIKASQPASSEVARPSQTFNRAWFDKEIKKLEEERAMYVKTIPKKDTESKKEFICKAETILKLRADNLMNQQLIVDIAKDRNLLKPHEIRFFNQDLESLKNSRSCYSQRSSAIKSPRNI